MAIPTLTSAVTPYPASAQGVSIAPPSGAWVNSSWGMLSASMPYNAALASITYYPGSNGEFEIDIGVGGTPTVISTIKGCNLFNDLSPPNRQSFFDTATILLPLPVDSILSGQQLSARFRTPGGYGVGHENWRFRVGVIPHPITGTIPLTTSPLKCFSNSAYATLFTLSSAPAWGNSGWQNLGTFSADAVIAGVTHTYASDLSSEWEVDLGVGGNVRCTIRSSMGSNSGCGRMTMFWNPMDLFFSGETLQARVRCQTGGTSTTRFTVMYYEKPL